MAICIKDHRYLDDFLILPDSQAGSGRHKCAGCAYERGRESGLKRDEELDLDLASLPDSQAGSARHKSPHAAWAMGYLGGVRLSYGWAER